MSQWTDDKHWSDRFLPEIKRHLGEHLIAEPPFEEDMKRNSDLMVLTLDSIRIGCRIRRPGYIKLYGGEFTIRAGRPSGAKTELTKILEGWGDYFFYGHSDAQEEALERWMLGDLKAFRIWFFRALYAGEHPWKEQSNKDNSSWFMGIQVADVPDFVVASNWFPETKNSDWI